MAKIRATSSKKPDLCWPGYEPVPGKQAHSQGSCRPLKEKQTTAEEKKFRSARKRQLDRWQKDHPGSPRKAAQHLHAPTIHKSKSKSKSKSKKKD